MTTDDKPAAELANQEEEKQEVALEPEKQVEENEPAAFIENTIDAKEENTANDEEEKDVEFDTK